MASNDCFINSINEFAFFIATIISFKYRFWYENGEEANPGGSLTLAQLQEIRKSSLSRTICDNLDDIDVLQPYVFLMFDEFSNRRINCRDTGPGSIPRWVHTRAYRKSQCFGFCTAKFRSWLFYESAVQKPKHCLT